MHTANNRLAKSGLLIHFYVILCCVGVFLLAIGSPKTTWDSLGYAAAISINSDTVPQKIHDQLYEDLAAFAGEEKFKELTSGSYREAMFESPELFVQQAPYYKIRVLFCAAVELVGVTGIGIFDSIHLVTAVFAAGSLYLAFLVFRPSVSPLLMLLLPAIFYLAGGVTLARTSTADSTALFFMLFVAYAYMHRTWLCFLLIPLIVAARTDLIILSGLVMVAMWAKRRISFLQMFALLVACLLVYFMIGRYAEGYGWNTLIHFVFVTNMQLTNPADYADVVISPSAYLGFLAGNIELDFPLILSCCCIWSILVIYGRQAFTGDFWGWCKAYMGRVDHADLVVFSAAYIAAHYLLFPALWERFFVGCYLLIFLVTIAELSRMIDREHAMQREAFKVDDKSLGA